MDIQSGITPSPKGICGWLKQFVSSFVVAYLVSIKRICALHMVASRQDSDCPLGILCSDFILALNTNEMLTESGFSDASISPHI